MRAASYQYSSYGSRTSLRSRGASAVLAVTIGLLLILALLTLGGLVDRRDRSDVLATFDVRPPAPVESSGARQRQRAQPTRRPESTPPAVVQPPPLPPTPFPDMIILTRRDFAAADIGRIRRSPKPVVPDQPQTADSELGDSAIGTGPDGQPMYNAAWYREPTDAELATYMPKRRVEAGEWGAIICKTVERYRVEDCRELGEAPGSGLAGMMRQAAWQFLIRPPRVGGKPMIGAWVRVRYSRASGAE